MDDASRTSWPTRGLALGLVPLAGLLTACGGGGGGGGSGGGTGDPLFVVASTPTNGQETLTDLSDPELNNRVTLTFSNLPRTKDMIDPANAFNGLTPNVQVLDQNFARVQGTPAVDPLTRTFTFAPAGATLPPAQYTVTVSRFVKSVDGGELGAGKDFSSSFTVGPDIYPPVIRNTSPAPLQNDTPLFTPIVITFNESLDLSTVVLGQTVFVQDGGTNPPTPINGTVTLERNGFDLVFKPDPCAGMPPSTTVVVRLVGTGYDQSLCGIPGGAFIPNTSFIRDRVGNGLLGDVCNTAGEVSFQFNTKGVKPLPNPCIVPHPGSPNLNLGGDAVYASTFNRLYALDVTPVLIDNINNGTFRPELTQQVLNGSNGLINWCTNPVTIGSFPYGGDFETRMERAGEAVVDWRFSGTDLHTYIYMVDEANDAVLIINSGNGKIEGRFQGVGTPRGIGLSGPGATGAAPTVFVTNYGQGTVTGFPLNGIQVGQPVCTALQELNDDVSRRVFLNTGRSPSGVSFEWNGSSIGAVSNQGDNTVTMFDPSTLASSGTLSLNYQVGESPTDVVWSPPTNVGLFSWIANQGGASDPDGSVSLWWSGAGGYIFQTGTGSILATLQDSINTPGRLHALQGTLFCAVPNTAGDSVTLLNLVSQGGAIFATFQPAVDSIRKVGLNPTKVTSEARFGRIFFASLAGSGQVAIYELQATLSPPALMNLPGVRSVFSIWDQ